MRTRSIPQAPSGVVEKTESEEKSALVALAGQPNVGKSTLFNVLTGLNQHVGNWPGKTVERKEGTFSSRGASYRVVDLPGTYSLTANSAEEVIAREFIIREQPDVVVALVDAAVLERSLYLVAELLPLPAPVIVALNMMDVAEHEGVQIEPQVLEAALGVPVVPMVATRNQGLEELRRAIDEAVGDGYLYSPTIPRIREDHQDILRDVEAVITGFVPAPYPQDWVALKLLEGDQEIAAMMESCLPRDRQQALNELLRAHDDALVAVASGRYEWIGRMTRAALTRPKTGRIGLTERVDRWATHPFWGLVILAGILGLAFWLTYAVGTPLQELLDTYVVGTLGTLARAALAGGPSWLADLVADGVIGGAGAIMTFLPILVIFFAVIATLEDVGYLARAAYVMDRFMHLMGLHGKSFLPLFLGFGCNVPAVLGCRVIESKRARLLTVLLAPLIPCTARMTVIAFLVPAFFGSAAPLVSWSMILLALAVLVVGGVLMNQLLFQGERAAFIMELPLYHLPNRRTIALRVWQRSLSFLRKAGTVILVVSVVIWALSVLPGGSIETSYLARLGHLLAPLGSLMGFDWRLTVALLTSFIAKENSIATLGVLFGSGEGPGLAATLAATFSPATALAFLTVQMLFVPCVATVAVVRQETSTKWMLFDLLFLLIVSLVAGTAVYWLAHSLGL